MQTILSALISKSCVSLKRSKWSQFSQNDWTQSFSSARIFVDEFHEDQKFRILPAFLFLDHKYRLMCEAFDNGTILFMRSICKLHLCDVIQSLNQQTIDLFITTKNKKKLVKMLNSSPQSIYSSTLNCDRHHRSFTIVADHYARTGSTNYVHCLAI